MELNDPITYFQYDLSSNISKTNQRNFIYYPNVFSSETLDRIESYCLSNLEFEYNNGNPKEDPKNSNLKRRTYNIPHIPDDNFYQILKSKILECNEVFNFELFNILNIMLSIYETNSYLEWHLDIGKDIYNQRKLSFSIGVNDVNDYEGGDLKIWDGITHSIKLNKGDIIFFPSFLPHCIETVTKNQKKTLVGFIGGRPYR